MEDQNRFNSIEDFDSDPGDSRAEELWSDEIKRRIADIRGGKAELIEAEEIRRRLSDRLAKRRILP